jgi:hypothetical protein
MHAKSGVIWGIPDEGERDERADAWPSPVSVAAQRNSLAPGILSAVRPLFFKSIQI